MKPRATTVLRRWKDKRDLIIAIVAKEGASHRLLGDVFDLCHSRIAAILKEQATKQKAEGKAE